MVPYIKCISLVLNFLIFCQIVYVISVRWKKCKVVIYKYLLCWLLFRVKFDCNLFNLVYPVFVVGICYKGCVIVRESVKTQAFEARRVFGGISQLSIPQKGTCALHMTGMPRVSPKRFSQYLATKHPSKRKHVTCTWLECQESVQMVTAGFCEYIAGKAFPQDTREIFCSVRLYYLITPFCTLTIYIPLLSTNGKESFWEKTLAKTLESLKLLSQQFFTHLFVEFPHLLHFHFQTIERLLGHKFTTPFESVKWRFGVVGKHWKRSHGLVDAIGLIAGFGELDKTGFREVLLE